MPDTIGNSFDSAQGTSLSPIFKTFTESIDPGDTDFYRFTLNRRSSFSLTLTNLSANLDVALFDGTGGAVVVDGVTQSSTNTGTLVESLNTILDPGTYYIQVFGGTPTATSAYNMNVLADDNVRSDVLWRNQAVGNGANVVWQLEGTQIANVLNPPPIPDVNWKAQASGDFNNDGLSDIVFRNTVSGDNVVWFLNETGSYIGEAALPQLTDINWDFVGAADFSGDGLADLALRNNVSGNNTVWLFSGTTFIGDSALPILPDTNFKLGGVGDFNGDGRPDLLWRNQVTGYNTIWALNGTDFVADAPIAAEPDLNLRFQGTGDFNRDGQTDILVRNFATGDNSIWAMSGTTRLQVIPFASLGDVNWVATAPFTRALPVVQKDLAGNQAAAFAIGALNGNGIYRDAVGGADPEDVYQFTVGSPTQLGLVLSGINGGALLGGVNVRLFNTSGTVGQNASPVGGVVNISRQIPAGTYFIQATGGSTTVGYELALAANNLPVLATNRLLVVSEGQAQTITPLLLRVTDENNTVEQITYSVATLPAQGSLLLDRSAITTGSLFSQADINNGRLQYSQNGSETLRDGFTFNVTDGVPGTVPINNASFSIQVVPVNDPPILLSNTALTLTEGSTVSLSSTVLFVTDTEQTDAQIRYTLSSLPTSGGLSLGGVPVTAGGTFTQADLAVPGRVIYRNNGSEASTDTFVFSASDGAGGIITPPTAAFSFNITNVNDIPVLVTNAGLTVTETGVRRIDNTLLRTTDSEQLTEALQDGIIYTVQTGPTQGTLTRNGTVTTTFTQADINNNRILYTETARGVNSDRFVFTVQDNVGEFTNPSPQTFNIAITGSNFVPVLTTNVGLSVTESLSAAITPTNLLVSDIDNAASELVYRVTKLPTNGFLKRFGTPLTALGETFTQADLNAPTSLISYQQNGSETTIDSFVFTVQDGNGNVAVPIDNTFSINVIAFNDAPQLLTNTRLTLSEGATANLTAGVLLQATDVDNLDSQITYNVTSGPLNGSLLRSGTTATSFTQADLTSAGLVRYQHNGSESTADSFLFEVVDLGGASAGTFTFNIAVTSVNDAPGLSLNTGLSLTEGASLNITDANLLLTDGDGPLPLIYTLTTAPTNGALRLAGSTVTTLGATNTFTQADITANRLTYIHNGSETTSDSFSFSASDSAPNGTAGLLPVTSFTIAVASVNDPPVLTVPGPLTVAEDNPLTLTGITRIQVSDPDTTPVTVTLSVGQGVINLPSGGAVVTGNDTNTVTVTGSTADLDIALNTLIYQPGANYNGPDTLSVSANDGNTTVDRTININVTPVNDAPTLSLSAASQTVDEDTPLALTIVTTDIDSGNTIIRSTLTAPNGRLTLATPGAVGFESGTTNGGSTLSLVGTISAIATALTNVSYQGARDFSGADTITVTVNDQGATGTGGALSVSRSLDVTVNPINDVPTFTLRTNSLTVNEDSGAQTTNLATNIFAGAVDEQAEQTLTFNLVSNSNAGLFSVQPTIDSNGTLTYTPAVNAFGSASIVVNLSDNGSSTPPNANTSANRTFSINVLPVNDAPSFSLVGSSFTVDEDATAQSILLATGITAGPGETQTVSFLVNSNSNPSLFSVAPTITPAGTLNYTLAANAFGSSIITTRLRDNGGVERGGVDTSALQTFTITARSINDPPVLTVPGPRTVDEDSTLTITGVSLTDADAGTQPVQVRLVAPRGSLGFATITGVTLTGNNTGTVQLAGSQADLNTALNSFTYVGQRDVFGADRITITADDRGNTGTGIGVDVETIDINVTAVNDAPILNASSLTRTVQEDVSSVIGTGLRITDVDSPNVQVTLSALQGTLTLTPNAGITVNDNGTATVTASGTVAGLNTALTALRYQGNLNFDSSNGVTDQVSILVDDSAGGTDSKTLTVTVTPVNDLPTLTVPTTLSVDEDTVLSFVPGTLLLTDADSGTNPISLGLSVASGTLSLATEGLTGSGNGTRTLSLTGTVDALRAALDTLTYQGNPNFNGSDRLNITVNDRGFTGAPSGTNVTGSVSLIVNSINDLPVLSRNNTLVVNEGNTGITPTPLTSAFLLVTDSDAADTAANLTYSIIAAPTNGNLFLNGTTFAGTTFTQADINSNRLSYRQNGSETLSDSFVFTAADTAGGSIAPTTFNISVQPGNDRPVLTTRLPLTVSEGGFGTINSTLLQVTDPDNTPAQVRYTLASRPGNGDLRLNGTNLSLGQSFSQAQVAASAITYRHNGSETTLDSFVFTVNDGAGGSVGATTFNINITSRNDAPVLLSKGPATVAEGGVSTLNNSLLFTTDADTPPTDLRYTLVANTTFGTLKLGATTLGSNDQFTQAQVSQITYEHNGSESTEDFFSFRVSDGIIPNPITDLFRFNIAPVNDSPEFTANIGLSIAANSNGSVTAITADQLGVTDVDNTPGTLLYTLVSSGDPTVGTLEVREGSATRILSPGGTFTQANIDNNELVYNYIGNGTNAIFEFTVADGPGASDLSGSFIISFT